MKKACFTLIIFSLLGLCSTFTQSYGASEILYTAVEGPNFTVTMPQPVTTPSGPELAKIGMSAYSSMDGDTEFKVLYTTVPQGVRPELFDEFVTGIKKGILDSSKSNGQTNVKVTEIREQKGRGWKGKLLQVDTNNRPSQFDLVAASDNGSELYVLNVTGPNCFLKSAVFFQSFKSKAQSPLNPVTIAIICIAVIAGALLLAWLGRKMVRK